MKKIIKQGAEAILYKEDEYLLKERIPKSYRISTLDQTLRKSRTRSEAKLLQKASISVPRVYDVDENKMIIKMDFVDGQVLKDVFDTLQHRDNICKQIGKSIATLHQQHIIHGDLTTSNMILKDHTVYFIDFGLGFISQRVEDKAVDLHLLRQALESKHYLHAEKTFKSVLEGYDYCKKDILRQLEKIGMRGRYKRKNAHT